MASLWENLPGIKTKATQKGNNNVLLVNSSIALTNARDKVESLLREGRDREAVAYIKQFLNGAGAQHPLYPEWRYGIECRKDGQISITHIPMNEEALKSNPFHGTVRVKIPDKYKHFENLNELIMYGQNRQISIELDVEHLETFIGDMLIHSMVSSEDKKITATIIPKKFPGPFPVKIYANNSAGLDFLEISVKEINDGIITIDNTQQNDARVFVVLKFDVDTGVQNNITFRINDKYTHTVEAHLMYSEIMLGAVKQGSIRGKDLKSNKQVFEVKGFEYDEKEVANIESSIELLRALKNIEDYFSVEFILPECAITTDEYDTIWKLKAIIEEGCIEGSYNEFSIDVDTQELMDKILDMFSDNKIGYSLEFRTKEQQIELWGQTILLPEVHHCFKECKLKDRQKLVEKRKLMDEGEIIKVIFQPMNENKYVARYNLLE